MKIYFDESLEMLHKQFIVHNRYIVYLYHWANAPAGKFFLFHIVIPTHCSWEREVQSLLFISSIMRGGLNEGHLASVSARDRKISCLVL